MTWFNKIFKRKKYIIEYTDSPKFIINILKKLKDRHSTINVNFANCQLRPAEAGSLNIRLQSRF